METLKNSNVFIVEDNAFYASLLKNELESFCNNVTVFSSGESCIENISLKPDVILLDYNLSKGMSGLDVLKKIKELNHSLPVVFVSGDYKLDVVKNALRFGAEDFIDKSDSGLSTVETRLKDIFHNNAVALEKKINRMAKMMTLAIFMFMISTIGLLFYLSLKQI